MGLFGKSFSEKVDDALAEIEAMGIGARKLAAKLDGKVVTLTGECPSLEVKTRIMHEFNARVNTDNTLNLIRIIAPEAPPAPAPAPVAAPVAPPVVEAAPAPAGERWHEVVRGETLGGIAKQYYGKASLYMKIFEANRDILDNPDLIKVGQKLRIPD